ncbi:hypothetical protein [Paenibacillus sp. UNC451MF]|uniref:hypothetical protein n=1 Tax=Paenibacillus sp. UNC451MF TaxID=1449063 RepID=UPI0018CC54CE|nr:hypothetical protein [Paenibacillus sp. UNC451MF]
MKFYTTRRSALNLPNNAKWIFLSRIGRTDRACCLSMVAVGWPVRRNSGIRWPSISPAFAMSALRQATGLPWTALSRSSSRLFAWRCSS